MFEEKGGTPIHVKYDRIISTSFEVNESFSPEVQSAIVHLSGLRQQVVQVVPPLVVEVEVLALRLTLGAHHFSDGWPVPAVLYQPCRRKGGRKEGHAVWVTVSVKMLQCETRVVKLNKVTAGEMGCFALKACADVIAIILPKKSLPDYCWVYLKQASLHKRNR